MLREKRVSIIGFSFGKDLVRLGYPVVQSVRSVLPICDRFVFVVGKSGDGTRELVASIDPTPGKVEIVDSVWPEVKIDGTVLSIEANKALDAAEEISKSLGGKNWGFYIQADEVVHEDDLEKIRWACNTWEDHSEVKALLFKYLHFVMDYQTTDPWMYHKASRIVRLDGSCRIIGDACGPAMTGYEGNVGNRDGYLDKNFLGTHVQWAAAPGSKDPARIFHYGWVKTRAQLDAKFDMVRKLWWGTLDDAERRRREENKFGKFMERYPILKNYRGTHPAVIRELIAQHPQYQTGRNRWLNARFYAEVMRHGFHG